MGWFVELWLMNNFRQEYHTSLNESGHDDKMVMVCSKVSCLFPKRTDDYH
jgi:hypothetical protein